MTQISLAPPLRQQRQKELPYLNIALGSWWEATLGQVWLLCLVHSGHTHTDAWLGVILLFLCNSSHLSFLFLLGLSCTVARLSWEGVQSISLWIIQSADYERYVSTPSWTSTCYPACAQRNPSVSSVCLGNESQFQLVSSGFHLSKMVTVWVIKRKDFRGHTILDLDISFASYWLRGLPSVT